MSQYDCHQAVCSCCGQEFVTSLRETDCPSCGERWIADYQDVESWG